MTGDRAFIEVSTYIERIGADTMIILHDDERDKSTKVGYMYMSIGNILGSVELYKKLHGENELSERLSTIADVYIQMMMQCMYGFPKDMGEKYIVKLGDITWERK